MRTPAEELVPRHYPRYVDFGMQGYLATKAFGGPLLLKGAKGTGKTMGIEEFAASADIPIVRHPCTEEDTARDLYGTFVEEGVFGLGSMTTAIDVANSEGACILVFEEINALSPRAQKMLNPLTDHRQEVTIQKIGRSFRVDQDKMLWVIGTMNPNYAGTYDLNEDLLSRFTVVDVGFMPKKQEMDILDTEWEFAFERQLDTRSRVAIKGLYDLATYTRSNAVGYALSTRDLVTTIRSWAQHDSMAKALLELSGKYEKIGLDEFKKRTASGLKINLDEVTLWAAPEGS